MWVASFDIVCWWQEQEARTALLRSRAKLRREDDSSGSGQCAVPQDEEREEHMNLFGQIVSEEPYCASVSV